METADYIDWDEGRDFGDASSSVAIAVCGNCGNTAKELRHVPEFDYMGCERCYDDAMAEIAREEEMLRNAKLAWDERERKALMGILSGFNEVA